MEPGLNKRIVGGNVDSWCGKCKLMLAHTIEAMVDDKPTRVNCNTCRSQHTYKPNPPGSRLARKGEDGAAHAVRPKSTSSRYQSALKAKSAGVAKTYSPQDKYEAGDVLDHPKFGRGVATIVKDATKIEVLFETGSKTLIHGR
jgi:hypothetical protein